MQQKVAQDNEANAHKIFGVPWGGGEFRGN
jgi:hypothetical protein